MFDRSYLKDLSKQRLRAGRGNAIVVVLLTIILGTLFSGSGVNFETDAETLQQEWNELEVSSALEEALPFVAGILGVAVLAALAYSIFVAGIIDFGCRGWFMRYWRGENPPVGELFATFRIYAPVLKSSLLVSVYIFLWSLLLIIPGIVKSYAYSMTPYIIYENPALSANEAIALSRKLTDGAKGDLFVFDLSYFGWMLLNVFTLGILGIVYIYPYQCTAHAAIYDALKVRAIQEGRVAWADFGQLPPQEPLYDAPQV